MDPILKIIADDPSLITYRPALRKVAKSVTATILLQQILHRWRLNGRKPFFKFKEKCSHRAYRKGDSWEEEIGFSPKEFDAAIKKIGYKKGKNKTFKQMSEEEALIIFYTDKDRMTWYEVNEENVKKALKKIYLVPDQKEDSYIPDGKLDSKPPKVSYPKSEITTEITTESLAEGQIQNSENTEQDRTDSNPDTEGNPYTDSNPDSQPDTKDSDSWDSEKKESFVAEPDSFNKPLSTKEINDMTQEEWEASLKAARDSEPPEINRLLLRKKHISNMDEPLYHKFLDAKKQDFNGNREIFDAYVSHELKLWDFKKCPRTEDQLKLKFEKELFLGHPVAKHFKNMTPEQRSRELELNS